MLTLTTDLPAGVVGIEATGEIDEHDYVDVLRPAIDAALTGRDKIRLLYVLGKDFEGYEHDAIWEDAKLGAEFFTAFERVAVVTDATWVRRSVKLFGWMIPGEFRHFPLSDLAAAREWVVADM